MMHVVCLVLSRWIWGTIRESGNGLATGMTGDVVESDSVGCVAAWLGSRPCHLWIRYANLLKLASVSCEAK
jgi:hypothetical protein